MKTCLCLLTILLGSGCAIAQPASVKFTMCVLDEETLAPVTNAVVQRYFEHQYDPWGNKPNVVDRQKTPVDHNGEVTFEGKSIKGGSGGSVFAEGYYSASQGEASKRKNPVLNRWEPWNPAIEVKMRPKKNPVPMVYQRILRRKIPVKEGMIGFDLQAADWIEPHGKGTLPDLIFTLTPVTVPKQGLEYSLTFENPMDGIQEYIPPEELRSEYIFPYEAPTNGYNASLNKYRLLYYPVIRDYPANNLKEDINYIFRVRTKMDDEGNIISANYGRIKGEVILSDTPLIDLQYWFNPDPGSRSLESAKKPY